MSLEHDPARIGHNSQMRDFDFDFDTASDGELVTAEVCAQILKRSTRTLAKERCTGEGITFVKFGHGVRYVVGDIRAEIQRRRCSSTAKKVAA